MQHCCRHSIGWVSTCIIIIEMSTVNSHTRTQCYSTRRISHFMFRCTVTGQGERVITPGPTPKASPAVSRSSSRSASPILGRAAMPIPGVMPGVMVLGNPLSPVDELTVKNSTTNGSDVMLYQHDFHENGTYALYMSCKTKDGGMTTMKQVGNDVKGLSSIALVGDCVVVLVNGKMEPIAYQPHGYFYGHSAPKETPKKLKMSSGLDIIDKEVALTRLESNGKNVLVAFASNCEKSFWFQYQGNLKFDFTGEREIPFIDIALGESKAIYLQQNDKIMGVRVDSLQSKEVGPVYNLPRSRVGAILAPYDEVFLVAYDGKRQGKAYVLKEGRLSPVR